MTYYRVKPEYDQTPRYRYGRHGGLIHDGIYIGKELWTEKELDREYASHLVGIPRDKLCDRLDLKRSEVFWFFGARFACADNI